MANGDSSQRKSGAGGFLLWVLVVALLLALGSGAYLFTRCQQHSAELVMKEKTDSVQLNKVDSMYTSTLTSLISYKGLNRQLDSIIAVRESDLKKCRSEFLAEVRKNQITVDDYKKQLAQMHGVDSAFQNQIIQLQNQNKLCKIAKDSLGRFILVQNDSLKVLNDSVTSLSKQVLVGSLLKPANITIQSTRSKKNNKDANTKKASKTDQLKICFDVPQNDMAKADTQVFHIRLINPDGETLTGSTPKTFILQTTGESVTYSIATKISYKKAPAHACAYFRAQVSYKPGVYTAEIYQKGYLVGSQIFMLK